MGNTRVHYYQKRKQTSTVATAAIAAVDLRQEIERGNYAEVKRIIICNRYLVHCPSGLIDDRPLHVAIQAGHQHIVTMLLHYGADPNARNAQWMTCVHLCVLHCRHQMIELLISCGANPNAVDGSNITPLELAMIMNEKYICTGYLPFIL